MADGYKVTDVRQRVRFTAGGAKVNYYDLTIETEEGATGTLRIDEKDYDKTTVKQRLDEFAAELDMPFKL